MAPNKDLFDALQDELALEVVKRLPLAPGTTYPARLAQTCRRLCRLVRSCRCSTIHGSGKGVLQAARAPASRAFAKVSKLHLLGGRTADVKKWALLQEAVTAAASAWPQLEEVDLSGGFGGSTGSCERGCLSGALLGLRGAPALRRLKLEVSDMYSLVYLPALTQLTYLELRSDYGGDAITIPDSAVIRPLADMPNLVSLKLSSLEAGGRLPCALPPNLTRLEMESCCDSSGPWDEHIGQCQHLKELELGHCSEINVHPTLLVQSLAAAELTALTQLKLELFEAVEENAEARLADALHTMFARAGIQQGEWGDWAPNPPLNRENGFDVVDACVMVPPPNMGNLSTLQHLNIDGWWLVVSHEVHWRALAGCSSLKSLQGLHASVPRPLGVIFRHLTRLEVTTSTSPGDTVTLLGAFPALQQLELTVAPPRRASADEQTQPPARLLQLKAVTRARIILLKPVGLAAAARAGCLAGYCSALWDVLPAVKELQLEWPRRVQLLPLLPHASALKQLSVLRLSSKESTEDGWEAQIVGVQQVVQMVQGATQLQALHVHLEPAPGTTKDQLVLGLQEALPGLTQLGVVDGAKGLEPSTRAALRQGLSVKRA